MKGYTDSTGHHFVEYKGVCYPFQTCKSIADAPLLKKIFESGAAFSQEKDVKDAALVWHIDDDEIYDLTQEK